MWTIAISLLSASVLLAGTLFNTFRRHVRPTPEQMSADKVAFERFMLEYQQKQNARQAGWPSRDSH
jgi:hypothetical protein